MKQIFSKLSPLLDAAENQRAWGWMAAAISDVLCKDMRAHRTEAVIKLRAIIVACYGAQWYYR